LENLKMIPNIETSAKESLSVYGLRQHKTWFDEKCLRFLNQRKQAKMRWLQNPKQSNVDNLNNVRREASGHSRNKKKEYLKVKKVNELETNGKIKNIRDLYRGISECKKGCQHRSNIVNDEKGDLITDAHSILARWRNHLSQLLNVHGVNDSRQTEIHTLE
jgi:hypothetical protein